MKNQKTSGAGGGEIASLPQEIILKIQCYLNGKEASRTSVLGKSWYSAWCTRPHLDFNQCDFRSCNSDAFSEFTKKTLQRYEDRNLNIESFTLLMETEFKDEPHCHNPSLAMELTVRALKLGPSHFKILPWNQNFVLPKELFESETLASLDASGCTIDLEEVTCSQLIFLHLRAVIVKGDAMVKDTLFSLDLSSKFPYLKDLALWNCHGYKDIRICSPSLERISLMGFKMFTAEFDVPNIRNFLFKGSVLSCLTFENTRWEWESDVRIICDQFSAAWFTSLNKLVKRLSQSKVSLSISMIFPPNWERCDCVEGLPVAVVESLTLLDHMPNMLKSRKLPPNFLNGLFMICRPKLMIQSWFPRNAWKDHNYLLKFVCKRLVAKLGGRRNGNGNCCFVPNPRIVGLKEVTAEIFEERVGEWRELPWTTLLDAFAYPGEEREVRFRLKWEGL
ncbi:hypothetical protein C2S51_021374 [Perilla frutescens var. frutescens]|nr:hypothetical protein C2S51_021374 [Perilla frutescens var. frutescens]